jgi:cyclopropane-fatty-acyl-phospholipid synthase
VQYIRDRNALPITRDYMLETERRYRELAAEPAATKKVRRSAPRRPALDPISA